MYLTHELHYITWHALHVQTACTDRQTEEQAVAVRTTWEQQHTADEAV